MIVEKFKKFRLAIGRTQKQLGQELGDVLPPARHDSTIACLEAGTRVGGARFIYQYLTYCDVMAELYDVPEDDVPTLWDFVLAAEEE